MDAGLVFLVIVLACMALFVVLALRSAFATPRERGICWGCRREFEGPGDFECRSEHEELK